MVLRNNHDGGLNGPRPGTGLGDYLSGTATQKMVCVGSMRTLMTTLMKGGEIWIGVATGGSTAGVQFQNGVVLGGRQAETPVGGVSPRLKKTSFLENGHRPRSWIFSDSNVVAGNYIGTRLTGTLTIPHDNNGVEIQTGRVVTRSAVAASGPERSFGSGKISSANGNEARRLDLSRLRSPCDVFPSLWE